LPRDVSVEIEAIAVYGK